MSKARRPVPDRRKFERLLNTIPGCSSRKEQIQTFVTAVSKVKKTDAGDLTKRLTALLKEPYGKSSWHPNEPTWDAFCTAFENEIRCPALDAECLQEGTGVEPPLPHERCNDHPHALMEEELFDRLGRDPIVELCLIPGFLRERLLNILARKRRLIELSIPTTRDASGACIMIADQLNVPDHESVVNAVRDSKDFLAAAAEVGAAQRLDRRSVLVLRDVDILLSRIGKDLGKPGWNSDMLLQFLTHLASWAMPVVLDSSVGVRMFTSVCPGISSPGKIFPIDAEPCSSWSQWIEDVCPPRFAKYCERISKAADRFPASFQFGIQKLEGGASISATEEAMKIKHFQVAKDILNLVPEHFANRMRAGNWEELALDVDVFIQAGIFRQDSLTPYVKLWSDAWTGAQ